MSTQPIPSKSGYRILSAPTVSELDLLVNEAVIDGYVPVGGITVVEPTHMTLFGGHALYAQAIVLHDLWK